MERKCLSAAYSFTPASLVVYYSALDRTSDPKHRDGGQLTTSFREPSDKAWNYMRPAGVGKAVSTQMVPRGHGDVFECVVLDGLTIKNALQLGRSAQFLSARRTRSSLIQPSPDAWKYLESHR